MPRHTSYPVIVKLHAKHDPMYYVANSKEDVYRAYYGILAFHASMGYYPTEENILAEAESVKKRQRDKLDSSAAFYLGEGKEEKLEELPEPIRSDIKEKLDKYRKSESRIDREYGQDLAFAKNVKKVLEAPVDEAIKMSYTSPRSGRRLSLLATLIMERAGYEYEHVEELTPSALPSSD